MVAVGQKRPAGQGSQASLPPQPAKLPGGHGVAAHMPVLDQALDARARQARGGLGQEPVGAHPVMRRFGHHRAVPGDAGLQIGVFRRVWHVQPAGHAGHRGAGAQRALMRRRVDAAGEA